MRLTLLGSGDVAPGIVPSDVGTIQVLTLIYKGLTTTYHHLCTCPLCFSPTALLVEQASGTGGTSFCLRAFALYSPFLQPDHASPRSFTQLAHSLTWFRCVLRCYPICHYPLTVFQFILLITYLYVHLFFIVSTCSCSIFVGLYSVHGSILGIYHTDWHMVLNKNLLEKKKRWH